MAAITCEDCQKWIVDVTKEKYATRGGKRQARKPNQMTPCRSCPKGGRKRASTLHLSRAHSLTVEIYLRARATHGAGLSDAERADPLLCSHLAVIDLTWREFEKGDIVQRLAAALPLSRKG